MISLPVKVPDFNKATAMISILAGCVATKGSAAS
jgi:hypothetical protein